jgi:hypothetical protein
VSEREREGEKKRKRRYEELSPFLISSHSLSFTTKKREKRTVSSKRYSQRKPATVITVRNAFCHQSLLFPQFGSPLSFALSFAPDRGDTHTQLFDVLSFSFLCNTERERERTKGRERGREG